MDSKSESNPSLTGNSAIDDWLTPSRFAFFLAAWIILSFPEVILGFQTFVFRDYGYFGYPIAHYYRESFWRGELPLWNPLSNFGLPFLAQWNTLVLYPLSLFYLFLPLPWSLGYFCLGHLFLAGLGMYFLAFYSTANRFAASVAGVAFAFNGLTLSCLIWPNNIAALGWMPWVVWLTIRAWREGGRLPLLAAGVGALQMLAGAPEVILFTWVLLGTLWLGELATGNRPRSQVLRRFVLVVGIITGLTAAQLLPFFDLLVHSQRYQGSISTEWSMPAWGWVNLLVPLFRYIQFEPSIFLQAGQYWTSSYYPGVAILALSLVAIGHKPIKQVRFLAVILLLSLVLALGENGYLYGWLKRMLPCFHYMRFPVKFVVLSTFLLPWLSAYAVAELRTLEVSKTLPFWRLAVVIWLTFLALIMGIVWFCYRYPGPLEESKLTFQSALSRAVLFTLIWAALFALGRVRDLKLNRMLMILLLVLVGFDLAKHLPNQNPTVSAAVLQTRLVHLNPQPRLGAARAMVTKSAMQEIDRMIFTQPQHDYLFHRYLLHGNCNLLENIPQVYGFFSLYLRKSSQALSLLHKLYNPNSSPLADFLGVSQITAVDHPPEWKPRSTFLPLATVGQEPVFWADLMTVIAMDSTNFNPQAVVYLPPEAKPFITATNRASVKLKTKTFAAHRIELETEADKPAMVVVAQSYYHNWRAYVDGKPVKLWCANYAFQALETPAGRHQVQLVYQDRLFHLGALISGLTLLGGIVAWFRMRAADVGQKPLCMNPKRHLMNHRDLSAVQPQPTGARTILSAFGPGRDQADRIVRAPAVRKILSA